MLVPMTDRETHRIAGNVRAEVARRRVSQAAIAEHLGLSQPGVSRRLRGVTAFSAAELVAVAELLGVTAASLLEDPQTSMAEAAGT